MFKWISDARGFRYEVGSLSTRASSAKTLSHLALARDSSAKLNVDLPVLCAFSKTKSVEEFAFYDIRSQRPEDFRPVLENPSIKRVYLWSLKPSYRKELGVTLNTYSRRVEKVNYLSDSDFAYR